MQLNFINLLIVLQLLPISQLTFGSNLSKEQDEVESQSEKVKPEDTNKAEVSNSR